MVMNSISRLISNAYNNASKAVSSAVSSVSGWIDDKTDAAGEAISTAWSNYTDWWNGTIADVSGAVEDVGQDIADLFTGETDKAYSYYPIDTDRAADYVAAMVKLGTDAMNSGTGEVGGASSGVLDTVKDLVVDITTTLGTGFEAAMAAVNLLPSLAINFIETITSTIDDFKAANPIALLTEVSSKLVEAMNNIDEFKDVHEGSVAGIIRENLIKLYSAIGMVTGSPMGFFPIIGDTYAAGQGVIVRHDAAEVFLPEILPPATLVEAKRRTLLDEKPFTHDMNRLGFSNKKAELLLSLYTKLLDINMLRELRLRGHIKDERVVSELEAQGYPADDIPDIMELFNVIPGVQDLILMAVREAFTPEIAEKFGQYQDYPPELTEWAEKQGLSETWAKRYWASHWGLPSAQIGFEMLHRGIIAKDELKLLLRAQDVMPFWRDKIVDVAYSPYTRVDVRRMHKIGVLDDEAVFTAYADVGFSPFAPEHEHASVSEAFNCETCRHDSKCGHMLDFTILYNYEPPEDEATAADKDKAKERDLTKSDILTGLRDGLFTDTEASQALGVLGYSPDETAYYLAKVEYQREKDELEDTTHYLHDAYIKGVITYGNATDELGKLNLPAKMTDYYLKVWDLEKIARTNKPTKSELMSFRRNKVIDEETWRTEMIGLGYPNRYIDWYATTV